MVSPFVFSHHTDYLKALRDSGKNRKKPIPLKTWAEKLGYKTSRSLELIIAGDRFPSEDFIFKLAQTQKLTAAERTYLSLMVKRGRLLQKRKDVKDIEEEMDRLRPAKFQIQYVDNETFQRVSEWYPLVIRQLAMTPQFKKDIGWISKKLRGKITSSQIAAALAEWEGLAFDRRALYSPQDIPSQAIRTFHKKMLQKAIEAVDEVPVEKREYNSVTFRASKEDLPKLKKQLREIVDGLNASFNNESANDVFQLSIVLFPHTDIK